MITVIGVRFRSAGKIYYFDPGEYEISRGMSVIVETARGMEMGMVIMPNTEVEDEKVIQPLKPVIRIAETQDFDVVRENKKKEKEAFRICQEKIREHKLEMKLIDVEYTFDNNKILFYFTADGRIDFRELVKDLAYIFRTRIELRQIGVRDETKILGGFGICGRTLCCHSYLSDFIPVSIRMAKEQNLSLNPTKISGVCGRLMCCLKNEEETYEYLNHQLPKQGEMVTVTEEGVEGTVAGTSVLSQMVKVMIRRENDEVEVKEYPVDALDFGPDRKAPVPVAAVWLPEEDPEQQKQNHGGRGGSYRRESRKDGEDKSEDRRNGKRNRRQGEGDNSQNSRRQEKSEKTEKTDKPEKNEEFRERSARRNRRPVKAERKSSEEEVYTEAKKKPRNSSGRPYRKRNNSRPAGQSKQHESQ